MRGERRGRAEPRSVPDTGPDTRLDTMPDTRVDTGQDTRLGTGQDTRPDTGQDTRPDTGLDTRADTGPGTAAIRWERTGGRLARTAVVLLLALSAPACTPLDDALAVVFGRHMRNQPSLSPYENPQMPAEGSVPFASGNLQPSPHGVSLGQAQPVDYDVPSFTVAELTTVAAALPNPVPATPESLERGRVMYERFCAVCHGMEGIGADAPIAQLHPLLPFFNLATGNAVGFADGYIYGLIRIGRGGMPPYGHQVPHFDRWHIVNYIRQLQRAAAPAGVGAVQGADAPGGGAAGAAGAAGDGGDVASSASTAGMDPAVATGGGN